MRGFTTKEHHEAYLGFLIVYDFVWFDVCVCWSLHASPRPVQSIAGRLEEKASQRRHSTRHRTSWFLRVFCFFLLPGHRIIQESMEKKLLSHCFWWICFLLECLGCNPVSAVTSTGLPHCSASICGSSSYVSPTPNSIRSMSSFSRSCHSLCHAVICHSALLHLPVIRVVFPLGGGGGLPHRVLP